MRGPRVHTPSFPCRLAAREQVVRGGDVKTLWTDAR